MTVLNCRPCANGIGRQPTADQRVGCSQVPRIGGYRLTTTRTAHILYLLYLLRESWTSRNGIGWHTFRH